MGWSSAGIPVTRTTASQRNATSIAGDSVGSWSATVFAGRVILGGPAVDALLPRLRPWADRRDTRAFPRRDEARGNSRTNRHAEPHDIDNRVCATYM